MERSLLRTDKEITQLYETYVDMVYRLCFTMLKNRFDTEDTVQNTFMKLMHHTKPFDSTEHEKAWLIVTASNTCKDTLRRASRREEPLEKQDTSYFAAWANICSFSSRESSLRTVFVLQ